VVQAFLLALTVFLISATTASAVSVTISNIPSSIDDSGFTFNASIAGASSGTNYLRANFSPPSTTSYFGYTYNNSSFINSSTCTDYLPVTIDSSGNWSGTVQAKIDTSSSYYSGAGSYGFKVRRYTSSCSSYIWSNELTATVTITTPSPSPSSSSSSAISSTSKFIVTNVPSTIDSTQTFTANIALSLPDYPNSKFYFKGAFKKPDSSNYFGLTKVGSGWVKNGSGYSDQYSATTDSSGNWSGSLEVQPDPFDSGYDGSGDYIFKAGRYTASGSGPSWSNENSLKINSSEVNDPISLIATSKPAVAPSGQVLAAEEQDLPEEVYSLESYRKLSTNSATPSAEQNTVVKAYSRFNPLFIIPGIILLIAGSALIIYTFKHGSGNKVS
jgi:hypothetical protein